MRAWVSGVGGFVGRHLAPRLSLAPLEAAEVVFHLAAMTDPRLCEADPEAAWRANVERTRELIAAAPPGARLVYLSTVHVYGRPEALPIPEEHPLRPRGAYARTKAAAEALVRESGRDHVILRAFNLFGPGQDPRYALAGWAGREGAVPVGDLSLWRDYLDVRDAVEGIVHLAGAAPSGAVLNLCRGEARRLDQLFARVAPRATPVGSRPSAEPPVLLGDPRRAEALGWRARRDLDADLDELSSRARP